MRGRIAALVGALVVTVAVGPSCGSGRYYIGTYTPGPGTGGQSGSGGSGGIGGAPAPATCTAAEGCRFAVDLDRSGASQLPDGLSLPGGTVTAALRYRGETASADSWTADRGPLLARGGGAPRPALPTPFTDATLAIGLASDAPTYLAGSADAAAGAVDNDDFVVEVVMRAAAGAPLVARNAAAAQASAGRGWSLLIDDNGALALDLADGARTVRLLSEGLVNRAWYHCVIWVSHAAGGRIDCDGRPGTLQDLTGLGPLTAIANLIVGGPATAPIQVALLQLFRASPGALGDPAGWSTASRTRFAMLTGILPRVATGTRLPAPGLRDSVAYLDMQRSAGGERSLFMVGADWARIACRSDSAGARDCGYLAEPERMRVVDAAASSWASSGLSVGAGDIVSVDGETHLEALIPTAVVESHRLTRRGAFSGPRQSFSFFAHAGAGHRVGVAVADRGTVIFDLLAGAVLSAPTAVTATIEPWGRGIFRCGYTFQSGGGALDYQLVLVDDAGVALFGGGDQVMPWIHVGGLQVDVNQPYPASLLAASAQQPDDLTFVADDGNLPASATTLDLRVLLPGGPRLNDQALVNINRAGSFDDQINLFVEGKRTVFEFWALGVPGTWTVVHPLMAKDGTRRRVTTSWGDGMARVWVDGVLASENVRDAPAPAARLDRLDVGFSLHSSAHLQGLLAGLQLKGP